MRRHQQTHKSGGQLCQITTLTGTDQCRVLFRAVDPLHTAAVVSLSGLSHSSGHHTCLVSQKLSLFYLQ